MMKTATTRLPDAVEATPLSTGIAVARVGDCVPLVFSGTVVAVYERAANVAVPLARGGLVTLSLAPYDAGPAGIALSAPAGFRFREAGVIERASVRCSEAGVLAAGRLRLDRSNVLPRSCGVGALRFDVAEPGASKALDAADAAYGSVPAECSASRGSFSHACREELLVRTVMTATALVAGDTRLVKASACGLVGLGEGATPAGDDALVGLMLATALTRHGAEPAPAERALIDTVTQAAWRTSDLSRSYLVLAAAGHFSAGLLGVARAFDALDPQAVDAAVRDAALVGHTSGTDGLLGVLCGLHAYAGSLGRFSDARGA